MSKLTVNALIQDREANSTLGGSFSATTTSREKVRERTLVDNPAETTINIGSAARHVCVSHQGLQDETTGDGATTIRWGWATTVYDYELAAGESAVVRLDSVSPKTQIFALVSAAGSPSYLEVVAFEGP